MIQRLSNNATVMKLMRRKWLPWVIATVVFALFSWLYMGNALTSCSTSTASLGSDSTGGMAWMQWVGGNDLSWEASTKSNYPYGEAINRPQLVTSALFISAYKVLASLTTPICGLNLIVLLGYLSCALTMFGLVKWLLGRSDIALFAGYAAAFVPFHLIKSQSHVNYIYGSLFIGIIWSFLWLISKPSYYRAILLGIVSCLSFYFDGYFILFSALLLAGLFGSYFAYEIIRFVFVKEKIQTKIGVMFRRIKFLLVAAITLGLLLVPIAVVYKSNSKQISESLASVRSPIISETLIYGARPIEFVAPAANNPLLPDSYAAWRMSKVHGSNPSESTLYLGTTIILLAIVALLYVLWPKKQSYKFKTIYYRRLIFMIGMTILLCFSLSLPAYAYIGGHSLRTPTWVMVHFTANWRVLSRLFLVIQPMVVVLASFGLYWLTKDRRKVVRMLIVLLCFGLLFLEYLPQPLSYAQDYYSSAPPIYKQLAHDKSVKVVAEYPLADFGYSPGIFTYQPLHNKILLNANDGGISKGPRDASIAGLNDPQTLGALKSLHIDEIITHGFISNNPDLILKLKEINYNLDKQINIPASSYAYILKPSVLAQPTLLQISKGYESLSVDNKQISHRAITNEAVFDLNHLTGDKNASFYSVGFSANSLCKQPAKITVSQNSKVIWQGQAGQTPVPISLNINDKPFNLKTEDCSIDITKMIAQAL
jgi:hypothetical protein